LKSLIETLLHKWDGHLARYDRLEACSTKGGGDYLGNFKYFLLDFGVDREIERV